MHNVNEIFTIQINNNNNNDMKKNLPRVTAYVDGQSLQWNLTCCILIMDIKSVEIWRKFIA